MSVVWDGFREGMRLLLAGDPYLWEIVILSARVSGIALLISGLLGIPLGALIGLVRFPGRRVVQALVYTGMGFPPVVVGLMVYLLLSRSGILGPMNWAWVPELFTVPAMILAQVIIAMPLIVGYTMAAVAEVDPNLRLQVRSLGATRQQVTWAILREARLGVLRRQLHRAAEALLGALPVARHSPGPPEEVVRFGVVGRRLHRRAERLHGIVGVAAAAGAESARAAGRRGRRPHRADAPPAARAGRRTRA